MPVSVSGAEPGGKAYRFKTISRDVGAGGLCAFTPRAMRPGDLVRLRIRFARAGSEPLQAAEFSLRGKVLRLEAQSGGGFLFAVSFLDR